MTEVSSSSMEFTPEEERILIKDIALAAEAKSKEGDTFYLITQRFETFFFFLIQSFLHHLVTLIL